MSSISSVDDPPSSGLSCIVAILRLHGVAADVPTLLQRMGLLSGRVEPDDLVRCARQNGLKSRALVYRTWKDLAGIALPAIAARLDGSGFFIIIRLVEEKALIFDGLTQKPELLTREGLESIWDGSLILVARRATLSDISGQFNIGWFMGAVTKYRRLLGEVLIASFMLNVFGLVSPLFFQVVVDKVLVHRDISTLDVLIIGLVAVSIFEAVGGAFQEIGKAEGVPIGACSTTNGLQQFGEALSEGGAVAQGIDGVVAGAQSGNILAAITSGLGGVAGVAGLASASTLQQYAAVGSELGSTALASQSGDILAALDGLVHAASTSGYLGTIVNSISTITSDITTEIEALYEGFIADEIVGTVAADSALSGEGQIDASLEYYAPVTISGISVLDASEPVRPDVNAIIAIVNGYETAPAKTPINELYIVNKGLGVGANSGPSVAFGDDLNQISAKAAYTDMIDNGVDPTTAQNIENIIAPLALGSAADPSGALKGVAAENFFTNPANASLIQNFDNTFTTNDAQILGSAVINTAITWCENNITNFTNDLPASEYPTIDTTTQGQLVELNLNGDLIYSATPGDLSTENGTKKQLFYDIDNDNWSAAQTDLKTLYGFTGNNALLDIGVKLVNENNTHL